MDQYHSYAAAAGDHSLPFNGQFEWPQAAYHQHHYSNLSDGSSDYTQHSFTYGSGVSTEAFEDFEDGEHEGRARLTGEQMAELERQFSSEPMPKTDRKAEIARKLRLNVPRVSVSVSCVKINSESLTDTFRCLELVSESASQSQTPKDTIR